MNSTPDGRFPYLNWWENLKIDSSNVLRILGPGVAIFWLIGICGILTLLGRQDKDLAGALSVLSIITASWSTGVCMLLLSRPA